MSDVAKVLVDLRLVKVCCSLTIVTVDVLFARCLCWLDLIFAVVQLQLNMGESSLRACLLEVARGCYKTSCDTLQ
jgi:hypothetical protein